MPHGRPTPLGKQFRAVLVNIAARSSTTSSSITRPIELRQRIRHVHCDQSKILARGGAPAAEETEYEEREPSQVAIPNSHFNHGRSARAVRRGERIDHLSDALRDTADSATHPYKPIGNKQDLSYLNVRSPTAFDDHFERQKTFEQLHLPNRTVSLQQILAAFIRATRAESPSSSILDAEWQEKAGQGYAPSALEAEFLQAKGHDLEDVAAWAGISTEADILIAAEKLFERTRIRGALSTPLFVYLNLLRRTHISTRALHILILCGHELFQQRRMTLENSGIDDEPLFLAAMRLIRHAREVWPEAFASILELVLDHLRNLKPTESRICRSTYQLNVLLRLVSLSTAETPFKHNVYQERAIVMILRYMAENEPPLPINREGYRAVIRLQLAQRKNSSEQEWAQLKSLSWPPWKADRTAMDILVDVDSHGTSRAAQTLAAMREAGYGPREWERTAQIYSGWDIDGTPTIQKRVRLDAVPGRYDGARGGLWAARISTTRTVQEAWACYLAWEDLGLPHNSAVYMAIAIKLREEGRRPHLERRQTSQEWAESKPAWPLLQGDGREVAPLPPSTHLYTYTRTTPPSLTRFYEEIRSKGAVLTERCLAYFVEHAPTLEFGLSCLRDHIDRYPEIQGILSLDPVHDLAKVQTTVYTAALALFGRFAYVSALKHLPPPTESSRPALLHGTTLHPYIGIVRAIELLRVRPDPHPPLWHAIFSGLTRETHLERFASLFITRPYDGGEHSLQKEGLSDELRYSEGAVNAYTLMRSIKHIRSKAKIDSDLRTFHFACVATENVAIAAWTILKETRAREHQDSSQDRSMERLNRSVSGVFFSWRDQRPGRTLRLEFGALMAPTDPSSSNTGQEPASNVGKGLVSLTSLPRLFAVPSPANLHAYIRALGWIADYTGLLELLHWMRDYQAELAERGSRDRRGQEMMRKAVVALRVFMERNFLLAGSETSGVVQFRPVEDDSAEQRPTDVSRKEPPGGESQRVSRPVMADHKLREQGIELLSRFRTSATEVQIQEARGIVESVEEWGEWATEEEVERYTTDKRFEKFRH